MKIFGAIELWRTRFDYRQDTVFNAGTYLGFLEQSLGDTAAKERF